MQNKPRFWRLPRKLKKVEKKREARDRMEQILAYAIIKSSSAVRLAAITAMPDRMPALKALDVAEVMIKTVDALKSLGPVRPWWSRAIRGGIDIGHPDGNFSAFVKHTYPQGAHVLSHEEAIGSLKSLRDHLVPNNLATIPTTLPHGSTH